MIILSSYVRLVIVQNTDNHRIVSEKCPYQRLTTCVAQVPNGTLLYNSNIYSCKEPYQREEGIVQW